MIGVIINKDFMLSKPIDIALIGIVGYYFLVGFAEELLCRGYIYNVIEGDKLKIIIPALSFASYHFISPEFNIPIFIILFIYGIIFAYIYKMIRNLWPLIIFHLIWDIGAKYTGYYSNPLIDLLCLGAIVIILKCIIEFKKNNNRLTKIIV
ncbi:CPBP family intramembrane glutamic endopeptidase [Clostridium estertheticum]|uniref:CPBP family intramembrane glutamic endopeptidase n=1 Tax=Clostridium estertheticum TaxID=238834 RepID=UPI001C0B2774|nr:CPBP family intramembrane glutamic endopeptidase [Clostridium estertheticum]MBU3075402.1 CPBP family intramembrane metalloprotease [Clostridium estertheticum]MBU3165579.1 CPBP family intramembrane metalloprotease [Clostridium estertheticum]